ncbi:hypothetical protein AB0G82_35390, partial [Streptomyces anulatus]|uniref:hypothetical protein n=1 Tax=Streptomyces anulatus TaxID=1892 RepID=UPI00340ABF2C
MTIPSTLSLFPLPGINNPYSEVIRPLDLRQWSPGTAAGRAVGVVQGAQELFHVFLGHGDAA